MRPRTREWHDSLRIKSRRSCADLKATALKLLLISHTVGGLGRLVNTGRIAVAESAPAEQCLIVCTSGPCQSHMPRPRLRDVRFKLVRAGATRPSLDDMGRSNYLFRKSVPVRIYVVSTSHKEYSEQRVTGWRGGCIFVNIKIHQAAGY